MNVKRVLSCGWSGFYRANFDFSDDWLAITEHWAVGGRYRTQVINAKAQRVFKDGRKVLAVNNDLVVNKFESKDVATEADGDES